ncbi:MAG: ATP-binding cassette domain-containing protein, partial [Kiritimatiellia bacterium]
MSTATPALQFDAVTAGYRNHLVLKDLSLTVNAGECVALLGPNGVGKTTCIQVATNRLPCQSGEVRLFGEPVTRLAAVRRAR